MIEIPAFSDAEAQPELPALREVPPGAWLAPILAAQPRSKPQRDRRAYNRAWNKKNRASVIARKKKARRVAQ